MVFISRPAKITLAPQFKKYKAVANPIPLEAPVTIIFLLRNSFETSLFDENFIFYSNKPNKKGMFAKIPAPAHHNILDDLREKKLSNPSEYKKLKIEIDNIFNVRPYTHKNIKFKSGLPVEVLLNLIKWLFIEQDVTYWNFSGRNMLMEGINNI